MLLLGILSLALAGGPAGGSEPEQEVVVPIRLDPDINGRHYYRGRAEDSGELGLILQITAFREDFYLHLTPDARFLAPGLATERLGVRLPALAAGSPDLRRCFYSGHVNGEPDSFAAVSLCGGLRGAFGYRGAEYVLGPLPNASAQAAPHPQPAPAPRPSAPQPQKGRTHTAARCSVFLPMPCALDMQPYLSSHALSIKWVKLLQVFKASYKAFSGKCFAPSFLTF